MGVTYMFGHIKALQAKLDILNAKIDQEALRPLPDSLKLQALKRKRVLLNDKILKASRKYHHPVHQAPQAFREATLNL